MERYIHSKITSANRNPSPPLMGIRDTELFIAEMEGEMGFSFGPEQKEAIRYAAQGHRVLAIGGYAGCGKTTISLAILKMYERYVGRDIECCALSGVAAKRIEGVTGYTSRTIHSLIKLGTDAEHDSDNPLDLDVVVLDEASMADTFIFYKLLRAIDFGKTRFLLLGDPGQLPPVGPGAPYTEILDHKMVPSVILKKIYRQSEDQAIVSIAASIRQGKVPEEMKRPMGYKDFSFFDTTPNNYWSRRNKGEENKRILRTESDEKTLAQIRAICQQAAPHWRQLMKNKEGLARLATFFQVAVPMRKGAIGIDNLNREIQSILNPGSEDVAEIKGAGGKVLRLGDKVIHLRNRNKKTINEYGGEGREVRVYNGQIGFVVQIDTDSKDFLVFYPAEEYIVHYGKQDFDEGEIDHAYALSVHKLQGAEALYVTVVVTWSHYMMLNARLLYTAVTRAKKSLMVVGERAAIERGCKVSDEARRRTYLDLLAREAS
jgi:exodeoxyribonuclease V alpha subunit